MRRAMKDGTTQVIETGAAYSRAEFLKRTGLTVAAFRAARRNGLKVRKCGKRTYITGQDWLSFLLQSDSERPYDD